MPDLTVLASIKLFGTAEDFRPAFLEQARVEKNLSTRQLTEIFGRPEFDPQPDENHSVDVLSVSLPRKQERTLENVRAAAVGNGYRIMPVGACMQLQCYLNANQAGKIFCGLYDILVCHEPVEYGGSQYMFRYTKKGNSWKLELYELRGCICWPDDWGFVFLKTGR